jgi:hypothetical protein
MALNRKRRRKREQRRHNEARRARGAPPAQGRRDGVLARFSPERLFAQRAREESRGAAPQETSLDSEGAQAAPRSAVPSPGLREAQKVERLAYTRRQAAEALGVSLSTIDRHVVPTIETVKTPWGQRLIPVDELERLLLTYRQPARGRPDRRPAGRPATLPRSIVERIRLECAQGQGFSEIARVLNAEGVPTAHSGRRWWPSTVRAVLVRSNASDSTRPGVQKAERGPYTVKETMRPFLSAASRPGNGTPASERPISCHLFADSFCASG